MHETFWMGKGQKSRAAKKFEVDLLGDPEKWLTEEGSVLYTVYPDV